MPTMSLWSEHVTAFSVSLAVFIVSSIAAKKCPLISVVAMALSLAPAMFAPMLGIDDKLGAHGFEYWSKIVLVIGFGSIPLLCMSAPRLGAITAGRKVRQCFGVYCSVDVALNMLWTLFFGVDDMLAKALGVCNVLLVVCLAVQTTALLCRGQPLVDITAGGCLIHLATPMSWAGAYCIWNIVFSWKNWGLSKSVHNFYCLIFMALMHKFDMNQGKDIGYYWVFARLVSLGWYGVQRVYRPFWLQPAGADFVLPADDYCFLLAVMYCTAMFAGVLLGLSLRDLWMARASGHRQASEQVASQEANKIPCVADPAVRVTV